MRIYFSAPDAICKKIEKASKFYTNRNAAICALLVKGFEKEEEESQQSRLVPRR